MIKKTDCKEFKACVKRFKEGGTDFTCEGCPGPDALIIRRFPPSAPSSAPGVRGRPMKGQRTEAGNLIERAKKRVSIPKAVRALAPEELELCKLWLRRELTNAQIGHAYNVSECGAVYRMSLCTREMVKRGMLVIR